METKIPVIVFTMMLILAGRSYGADEQASLGTQIESQSLGAQAGESAKELRGTVEESYETGTKKLGEASRKMEADAQDVFKTLQEQWNVLAKQFQEKAQQLQKQIDQQWQDFNKSFNKPKQ